MITVLSTNIDYKPIKIILALIKACDYRPFNLQYLGFFYEIHANVLFILSVFLVFISILELTDWGVKWKLSVNILKSSYKWMTFRVFLTDFSKSSYSHYQFVINVFLLWIIAFHNILNLPLDKGVNDWLPNTLLLSTIRYSIAYSVNKQELLISMIKCISSFDGYSH